MGPRSVLVILFYGISLLWSAFGDMEERIWLHAEVNGKPMQFCFDSGSAWSALCPDALQELGLKFIPDSTNHYSSEVRAGWTESFELKLEGTDTEASFLVLNLPNYVRPDFDGLIGWPMVRPNTIRIEAILGKLTLLSELPKEVAQWTRLTLYTNFDMLDLQVPFSGNSNRVLCVDTGSDNGLSLPAEEWSKWKQAHPHMSVTLVATYTPSDGFYVAEQTWAERVAIGPIVLTGVPIEQAGPFNARRLGNQYAGTIGLAALKRLDLIVDGKNGAAYARTKQHPPLSFSHNRLGAVFVPTARNTNQFVARVEEGTPASEGGIRDGDILMQVGDVVVTEWHDRWSSQFALPAGTKVKLTLRRGAETYTTTATLRDILGPNCKDSK